MQGLQRRNPLVVVVNTEVDFLATMKTLLEDEGYAAVTMLLADHPFTEIVRMGPDLLMIDFPYREEAAWQLLDQLAAESSTRSIPLIATSTDPDNLAGIGGRAGARRMAAVALKPLDLEHLLALVVSLLGTD